MRYTPVVGNIEVARVALVCLNGILEFGTSPVRSGMIEEAIRRSEVSPNKWLQVNVIPVVELDRIPAEREIATWGPYVVRQLRYVSTIIFVGRGELILPWIVFPDSKKTFVLPRLTSQICRSVSLREQWIELLAQLLRES